MCLTILTARFFTPFSRSGISSYSFNTRAVPLRNLLASGPCPNLLWPQAAHMVIPQAKQKDEVNDLVLEQIYLLKQPANLTDSELLEYHLRHLQIMTLYRKLDQAVRNGYYTRSLA